MLLLSSLLLYLVLGAVAGVVAGLFGVGGGVIIVPALIYSFLWQGVPESVLTHLAVGTSLATIAITSISSVRAHHEHGAVQWSIVAWMAPAIVIGVWLGANIAHGLSGQSLQLAFGAFLLCVAVQMGLGLQPAGNRIKVLKTNLLLPAGIVGTVSAMFGIGGGSLTVPYLSWQGVAMQKAVATSAAVGLPIAVAGALSNTWVGWGQADLPNYATGYIYWPAFMGIIVASAYSARLGARLAHRLSSLQLKRCFALFLLLLGFHLVLKNI